jgi:nucleoside-diphosphate-sugar epimerase
MTANAHGHDPARPLCVVTGGAGFVGRHIVRALLDDHRDDIRPVPPQAATPGAPPGAQPPPRWRVVVLDLAPYVHDHHHHQQPSGEEPNPVHAVAGDITRLGDVVAAFAGASLVIHAATANPLDNKNVDLMWRVNVDGTKNVVEACKQCAVHRLVFVSSASVVFDGSSMLRVDETRPHPTRYIDYYSMTKAEAEKFVLAANKPALATCAIRPSAVFGEGDRVFLPRVAEVGRNGKSKFAIGDGTTLWDFTYAGNVAHACLAAAAKLAPDSPLAGQAYFVTNADPRPCWHVFGTIQSKLGYPPPSIFIPVWICYILATIVDCILALIKPIYAPAKPPSFSRERVRLLTCHRTFSCDKAKRDFGYVPQVSMDEALDRTIASYPELAAPTLHQPVKAFPIVSPAKTI